MGPAAFTGAWRAIVSPFLPECLPAFFLPTVRLPMPGKSFPPVWASWNGPMRFSLQALQGTGLTVPDDIGIVTFHNRPMAEYLAPSLSVLRLDGERFGAEAVRMLVERINCPALPPEQLLIPPQLVVRESSVSRNPLFPLRWDDVSGRDF